MKQQVYRYTFDAKVPLEQAEETLLLAVYAAEGVHGAARVRLEAGYLLDRESRTCVVEASTAVGETVAQVFTGYLTREFGEDSFQVESVSEAELTSPAGGGRKAEAAR